MRDQVIMDTNGNLAIAIPLFRHHHKDELVSTDGYALSVASQRPLAYALDIGDEGCQLVNAKFLEERSGCEFLGEL
jgi:hypothetical protein